MQTRLEQLQGLTQEELIAKLLKAEAPTKAGKLTLKVGEKGGISLYGTGRFPVTQYAESWVKILDMADEIRAFIAENQDVLSFKNGIPSMGIPAPAKQD